MGYEYIKGLQSYNVSTTIKHYMAFSMPEQGVNLAPVHGGERELRTTYDCLNPLPGESKPADTEEYSWAPPFKRGIEAGAWSIMGAYSRYETSRDKPHIAQLTD